MIWSHGKKWWWVWLFLGFSNEVDHPEASFFSGKLRLPCNNKLLWSSRNHALKSLHCFFTTAISWEAWNIIRFTDRASKTRRFWTLLETQTLLFNLPMTIDKWSYQNLGDKGTDIRIIYWTARDYFCNFPWEKNFQSVTQMTKEAWIYFSIYVFKIVNPSSLKPFCLGQKRRSCYLWLIAILWFLGAINSLDEVVSPRAAISLHL